LPGKKLALPVSGHSGVKVLNISIKLFFFGRRFKYTLHDALFANTPINYSTNNQSTNNHSIAL
jgi:hypothetical protein